MHPEHTNSPLLTEHPIFWFRSESPQDIESCKWAIPLDSSPHPRKDYEKVTLEKEGMSPCLNLPQRCTCFQEAETRTPAGTESARGLLGDNSEASY